jgi:hypothetical protein
MISEIRLEFGTYEDKTWLFNLVNFDLSNVTLRSEIRTDDDVLVGELMPTILTSSQFTLTINSSVSGLISPGEYVCDVLARNSVTSLQTFITPVFPVIVVNRVTQPVTVP